MNIPRWLVPLLLGLGAGLLVFFLLPDPAPEVRYQRVEVPVEVLIKGEPDTIVRWRERVVTRVVRADQVATAPAAALPDVAAFCSSAGWYPDQVESTDTVEVRTADGRPSVLLLRSIAYNRGELTLTGPQSDGDLWRGDYRVGSSFTARVMGDDVLVQSSRWSWVRDWGEKALWAAGGAAIGYTAGELR